MGTAPEGFSLYGHAYYCRGIRFFLYKFLSCGNLVSEADGPMVVSDVEAEMWTSAVAARLPSGAECLGSRQGQRTGAVL